MNCPRCSKPIDAHEAGRETDICVAMAVMGIKNLNSIERGFEFNPELLRAGGKAWINDQEIIEPPPYSTSIADAWEVVEKMSTTTKEYWHIDYYSTGAIVEFIYDGGRNLPWKVGEFEADGSELPIAICRVALKAVNEGLD